MNIDADYISQSTRKSLKNYPKSLEIGIGDQEMCIGSCFMVSGGDVRVLPGLLHSEFRDLQGSTRPEVRKNVPGGLPRLLQLAP